MNTPFNNRAGLVVWLYTPKYVNKLKRYGLVHYVSKSMNYAVVYVDKNEKEQTEQTLKKQHFVRNVENCYNCELPFTFDGVLDEVTKLAEEKKKKEEENEFSLFTQLSDWSGN